MGKYLTAEDILSVDDFVFDEIECPEWGGTIRIRSLSGGQRATIKKAIDNGSEDIDEMVCVMGIVDENGRRILEKKHISVLSSKSTKPVSRIAIRILEISGMREPKKAVEDAEKNLDGTESDDSSFD